MQCSIVKPIALLTCQGLNEYKNGDYEIIKALARLGFEAEHVVWDKPSKEWSHYQAVVVLSTWDYHKSEDQFKKFITTLTSIHNASVPLLNSLDRITWNGKKTYLQDVSKKGFPVIDTVWVSKKDLVNLGSRIPGWTQCVIKPVLSASGSHTKKFSICDVDKVIAECQQLDIEEWMIQPFASEVIDEGEYSFIYLGREFSHCVLKRPAPGPDNFITGAHSGAINSEIIPAPWMREQAQRIIDAFAQTNLHTRLDVLICDHKLKVMEIEMIEPYLYDGFCDGFADKFAAALVKRIKDRGPCVQDAYLKPDAHAQATAMATVKAIRAFFCI